MTEEPDEIMAKNPLELLNKDTLVVLILMGIAALVGLIGNIILVRAVLMYRSLRVDVYVVIAGLAVADMMHLLIAVPAHYVYFLEAIQHTEWCKASIYLMNSTSYIAAYHLVILAVLRGILLTNRGQSSPTGRHAFYCSIVVWVVGALASVPVVQVWASEYGFCVYTVDSHPEKERWLTASFSCFVPISMMLLIYATTYYIGKRFFADSYSRHEKQMSRLVTAVMISFVICETPYNVINLIFNEYTAYDTGEEYIETLSVIQDYFLCLQLLGRSIRPVLYSKLSSDLGECFDDVINCTYCHRYYSDGPKREDRDNTANSRAPLTNEQPQEAANEEVV